MEFVDIYDYHRRFGKYSRKNYIYEHRTTEQRPGAGLSQYKFRLVPSSDTKQAPSAGFAPITSELSSNLHRRTRQPRCPRCRAQNIKVFLFT
jgi:hypothetical protein